LKTAIITKVLAVYDDTKYMHLGRIIRVGDEVETFVKDNITKRSYELFIDGESDGEWTKGYTIDWTYIDNPEAPLWKLIND
jgi:hypothetical protein